MTFEDIVIAIFWCFIFALITLGLLFLIKFIIIYPPVIKKNYCINIQKTE